MEVDHERGVFMFLSITASGERPAEFDIIFFSCQMPQKFELARGRTPRDHVFDWFKKNPSCIYAFTWLTFCGS